MFQCLDDRAHLRAQRALHHDRVAGADGVEHGRLQFRRGLGIAALAQRGKGLPERVHQGPGTEDEVDLGGFQRRRQAPVQAFALGAEFQHVAEHGDAAALRPDRRLAEQRDGRRHGGRVGVVAFVDQQRAAAGHLQRHAGAAADRRLELAERQRGERQIGAGERGGGEHGERVLHHVAAGRAELVGDRLAENDGLDGRAFRLQRIAHQKGVGIFVFAEGNDAGDVRFLRRGDETVDIDRCRG